MIVINLVNMISSFLRHIGPNFLSGFVMIKNKAKIVASGFF